MASPGYSGTPLLKKLGIREEMKIRLIHPPSAYTEWLETDIRKQLCKKDEVPDFIHLFVKDKKEFETEMKSVLTYAKRNPSLMIWVSWYKKASGIKTDITEDTIRIYALQHDLVDVKVCAVSEEWSGLKLVVPLVKRR